MYPVHTLAPDPKAPELDLRPPEPPRNILPRDSPRIPRFACRGCGGLHFTNGQVLACMAGM